MKKIMHAMAVALAATLAFSLGAPTASAAAWSSSDKWGTWNNGGYIIRNDVWGSGAGPQSIWANSYSNWGVWANHPNTGGVKAYPHAGKPVNRRRCDHAEIPEARKTSSERARDRRRAHPERMGILCQA